MPIVLLLLVGCSNKQTIRVAAVQLNCKVGELDANLANAEKFIRDAFEHDADLVILPEFFTTPGFGFPFHQKVLDAVEPLEGETMKLLKALSQEYNGIIGGSFLAFHGENTYNSFVLIFPDGNYYVHNKDYPTYNENCYYTGGEDDGVFETKIGNIGVALCWEYIRTGTARRMLDRVDIVIGGSCWPARKDPESTPDSLGLSRLKQVPIDFASLLGVPVIHANHVGEITESLFWKEDTIEDFTFFFLGETQIIDGKGEIIKKLTYSDGEGIIWADVKLGKVKNPTSPIPDRFWIPEWGEKQHEGWKEALTGHHRKYYEEIALPYYIKKWKNSEIVRPIGNGK